jgi:hypothetical protein
MKMPDKMLEMQKLFYDEAERNQVPFRFTGNALNFDDQTQAEDAPPILSESPSS